MSRYVSPVFQHPCKPHRFPHLCLSRRSHKFALSCKVPVDFEYQLTKLQDDESFTVSPLSGKTNLFIVIQLLYDENVCSSPRCAQTSSDGDAFSFWYKLVESPIGEKTTFANHMKRTT